MKAILKPIKPEEVEYYPCNEVYVDEILNFGDEVNKVEVLTRWDGSFWGFTINNSNPAISPHQGDIIYKKKNGLILFMKDDAFYNHFKILN